MPKFYFYSQAKLLIKRSIPAVLLLFLWFTITSLGWDIDTSLPHPIKVARAFYSDLNLLIESTYLSVFRLVIGVMLGALLALISAIAVFSFQSPRKFISPIVAFMAPIPVVVWIPVFISLLGNGEITKVSLVALSSSLVLYISFVIAFDGIERQHIDLFRLLNKNFYDRVRWLFVPRALDASGSTIRIVFGLAWIVLFIAEFGAKNNVGGLGYYIRLAENTGRIEQKFAGVVMLSVAAVLIDFFVLKFVNWSLRWKELKEGHGQVLSRNQ